MKRIGILFFVVATSLVSFAANQLARADVSSTVNRQQNSFKYTLRVQLKHKEGKSALKGDIAVVSVPLPAGELPPTSIVTPNGWVARHDSKSGNLTWMVRQLDQLQDTRRARVIRVGESLEFGFSHRLPPRPVAVEILDLNSGREMHVANLPGYPVVKGRFTVRGSMWQPWSKTQVSAEVSVDGQSNISFLRPGEDGHFVIPHKPVPRVDILFRKRGFLTKKLLGITLGSLDRDLGVVQLIPGDANGDNRVNSADLRLVDRALKTRFGQERFNADSDLNGDLLVDSTDRSLVTANLGQVGD